MVAVAATIVAIDMPYATYFEGAQFVHFLLGTATVALAVPIHRGLAALRGRAVPLVAALLGGGAVSIATAIGAATLLGVDAPLQQGLWAKSVTAPIAMGVAERIGASPTLTAVYAVVTGVLGAALGRFVLDAVGCRAWWQRGAAIGIGDRHRRARHRHLARVQRAPRGGRVGEPRDGAARRARRGADPAGVRALNASPTPANRDVRGSGTVDVPMHAKTPRCPKTPSIRAVAVGPARQATRTR